MKRFLVTEEDRKHIMKLYERIGDKLTPEGSKSLKAEYTKKVATFLNSYYNIKLPAAITGNFYDKNYNETLKRFYEDNDIPVWICSKGDGYCSDYHEGEVTTKDLDKLRQVMLKYKNIWIPIFSQQQNTTNNTQNTTAPIQAEFKFEYKNDENYRYAHHQGKWFAQNVKTGKVFDLTLNPKFKSSVDNLNKEFASQIQTSES
jgi:hypothetical protein